MEIIKKLLDNNSEWVKEKLETDSEYFTNLAKGQKPQVLWIGCSDSRVPANEVTKTAPGEIFVHRNIANMVVHSDMNMLSVVDYAVNHLKVEHVIVVGHYECGGVKASMGNSQNGIVDNWIRHIKDVYRIYQNELEAITDEQKRFNRLVELNVYEQVLSLSKTSIIQNAWNNNANSPKIHGWVLDIKTGTILDQKCTFFNKDQLPDIYKFNM